MNVLQESATISLFCSSAIHANEICNIYDKQMHLQPPFQQFYEQGVRGVKDVSIDLMRCS
jgi:hypothetical protein